MQAKAFTAGLRAISSITQYAKKIDDDSAQFIWMTLDQKVKDEITDAMWVWAIKKTMEQWKSLDHNLPLHIIALSFLYRQRDGMPEFEWGLKADLADQMLPATRQPAALCAQVHSQGSDWL